MWRIQFWNVCAGKAKNGKFIGGSSVHTPIKKNRSANVSLDWSGHEMVKIKSLRKLMNTSSRLKIPDFSRSDFDCFKWKEILSWGPFQGAHRARLFPREGGLGDSGDQDLARQGVLHCCKRGLSGQSKQNRGNDSNRVFQCYSDHQRSWGTESHPKSCWESKMTVQKQLDTAGFKFTYSRSPRVHAGWGLDS